MVNKKNIVIIVQETINTARGKKNENTRKKMRPVGRTEVELAKGHRSTDHMQSINVLSSKDICHNGTEIYPSG